MNMRNTDRTLLLSLPLISIGAEILKSFFESSPVMALRNYLCMAAVLYLTLRYFGQVLRFNLALVLLVVYSAVLLVVQQAGLEAWNFWIMTFQAKLMMPLAFILWAGMEDQKRWSNTILITGSLFAVFILLFLLLGIGVNQYGGADGFTAGSFKFSRIYTGSFVMLALPMAWWLTETRWVRRWIPVLAILLIVILILSTRRTSWLVIATGAGVFAIYFHRRLFRLLRMAALAALLLLAAWPLYKDVLTRQLEKRQHVFVEQKGFDLESETRFEETLAVWRERIGHADPLVTWFGEHLFDSIGNYDQGIHRDRPLHLDINIMLHGAGLFGLMLFVLFHAELALTFLQLRAPLSTDTDRLLEATFLSTALSMVLLTFSGGMAAVTHNMVASILAGSCLAALSARRKQEFRKITDGPPKPMLYTRRHVL